MTVYVTAISPSAAQRDEHISSIRWLDSNNSTSNTMSVAQAVNWMNDGHSLFVAGPAGPVGVEVVEAGTPYIRTMANGAVADNLLQLPRF